MHRQKKLYAAIENSDLATVKNLLARSLFSKPISIECEDDKGNTPLIIAAILGKADIVHFLLQSGAEVDKRNKTGGSALLAASLYGHDDVVEMLVKDNADMDIEDQFGSTPLNCAVKKGFYKIVKLLVKHGCNLNRCTRGHSPLLLAIWEKRTDIAALLIEAGCDIKQKLQIQGDDKRLDGCTALILSALYGDTETVRLLLDRNATIDSATEKGITALKIAVNQKHDETAALLIDRGADLNTRDGRGNTPLMDAIYGGMDGVMVQLIDHGANLDLQDKIGYTALMIAAESGKYDAVRLLLQGKPGIDIADNVGFTALMLASWKGHMDIVHLLLENKARTDLVNNKGYSARQIAHLQGHKEIEAMLEKAENYSTYCPKVDDGLFIDELEDRTVSVFVSSTFSDMFEEREVLVKKVFPQLKKLCDQRNVTWCEVDLRWGITDEQIAGGKLLPICLKAIERCRPYFIGILGERYGSVLNEIPQDLSSDYNWLDEHRTKSVTEIEILHGVLIKPEAANHAYFYFRDPAYLEKLGIKKEELHLYREVPGPDEISACGLKQAQARAARRKKKLTQLKRKIKEGGFPVCENYATPEAFGQQVLRESGRSRGLRPDRPLRTGQDSFPSSGSSVS